MSVLRISDLFASTDPVLPGWAQYGIAGLVILAFVTDQIVTGRKYNAVVRERDEERARTERAEEKLEKNFLPALLETQSAIKLVNEQMLPLVDDLRRVLSQLRDEIDELRRRR